jgi:hypothetical protein
MVTQVQLELAGDEFRAAAWPALELRLSKFRTTIWVRPKLINMADRTQK